jgi:hypothetical protein
MICLLKRFYCIRTASFSQSFPIVFNAFLLRREMIREAMQANRIRRSTLVAKVSSRMPYRD